MTPTSDPQTAPDAPQVVLCPGQGAQALGMGQAWAQQHPAAAQTFAEADDLLSMKLAKVCFEGPEDQLHRTDIAQAAIYVCSVACHRAMRQSGQAGPMAAAAGLSLGEFTALHLAGAFDFETGLKLVRLRGQAMQEAAEATPSGMVAVMGASPEQAQTLCHDALATMDQAGNVLVPANFNCPGQIVLSGSQAACQAALVTADQMGLKAKKLVVAGAFHSPIMQPAADRLAKAMDQVQWQKPTVPVLSNVTGQAHDIHDVESIKRLLVAQLTSPVRWEACMQWAIQNLKGQYIELAPGKVLAGLMRRIDRQTSVKSHDTPI